MSFLKSLFGGSKTGDKAGDRQAASAAATTEHKGFSIEARPFKEGGQYQLAGVIAKEFSGVRKEHKFVRADRFAGLDEATQIALAQGRQIVDERGDALFD